MSIEAECKLPCFPRQQRVVILCVCGLSPLEHSPVVEAEIPDTRVIQSEALLAPTERPL